MENKEIARKLLNDICTSKRVYCGPNSAIIYADIMLASLAESFPELKPVLDELRTIKPKK